MRLLLSPLRGIVSFLVKSEATRLFSLIYSKLRILIASSQFLIGRPIAREDCSCVALPILLGKNEISTSLGQIWIFGAELGGVVLDLFFDTVLVTSIRSRLYSWRQLFNNIRSNRFQCWTGGNRSLKIELVGRKWRRYFVRQQQKKRLFQCLWRQKEGKTLKSTHNPILFAAFFFFAHKNVNTIAELYFLCLLYFFIESE